MSLEIGKLTRLPLGIAGESNSRVIRVDVRDWLEEWPGAAVNVIVCRPGEDEYYPASTEVKDGILTWKISRADVQIPGRGVAQFVLTDSNDVELRSRVVETMIACSIRGTQGSAPDPATGWVHEVLQAAKDAAQAVDKMPIIGENKNWWIWNSTLGEFVDSGVLAEGRDGTDAQDSVLVCRVAFDDFIGEYCDTSFNAVDKAVSDGKACFLISETGVVYSYSGVVREFGESYHKFMRQVFTGMDFNEEYYLLSHHSKLTFGAKAPPIVPVEPVVNIGPCELYWEDLGEYDDEQKAILLEAGKPVFAYWVQSVFDGLADSSAVLTIGGVDYTVRGFGEIKDSLMYKDGSLQLCRKISDAGDELRTSGYGYETIPCDDLSSVIDYIELPCQPNDIFSKTLASVSYAECGAYLDGIHDDYEAMYRAHFIGYQTGCDVIQHGGTIYKALSGWLYVRNHNVDLSGSVQTINEYNRYGYYWLSATSVWTLNESVITALRPQMKRYSNYWPAVETGFPANGLFVVTHPDAVVRWNEGERTYEDRIEVVRHGADGRVYSTVIDDAPSNAEVVFHKYPETQLTFRGCTLNIDIAFGSVPMYYMRCERSNAVIRDFVINPTRRTTMNIGYRGAVFTLNECADITMENIKGINIAGKPREEYPRGVAGYILNAASILDLTVRDCNLLGYWGCVGLNGAKEITFEGCELNRVDIHDYFRNLTIDNCRIYGQTINFGYGKGAVNISNCSVMTDWVHQIVNLRCDYGRYFEGTINICNVDAVYTGPTYFDIVSGVTMFSAESAANTGLFMKRYPNVNVSNVTIHLMKESTAGYVFNMPTTLEDTIEIADKRKVVEYSNVVAYDENGDVQQLGLCSLDGVVQSRVLTLAGFAEELRDISTRLAALEANGGSGGGATTDVFYTADGQVFTTVDAAVLHVQKGEQ